MIRIQIGQKVATINGNTIEVRDLELRRELRPIADLFSDHPGYLPPPEEQILNLIREGHPELRVPSSAKAISRASSSVPRSELRSRPGTTNGPSIRS